VSPVVRWRETADIGFSNIYILSFLLVGLIS
jgi:hypothetical protein